MRTIEMLQKICDKEDIILHALPMGKHGGVALRSEDGGKGILYEESAEYWEQQSIGTALGKALNKLLTDI